jgi:UDP-N-acetyl-2-amino-2-deoxyglucuronate dehydrogenase
MKRMLRVALVGCGRISKNHIETLKALEAEGRAKLVACCDSIPDRAKAAAELAGGKCKPFKNYPEMLSSAECELVSICTPSGLHPEHVIQAAEAGRHALSEKPSGTKLSDVDRAIGACDRAGVKYFVVKQNRFNKTIRLLKKALDLGRFGHINMLLSNVLWTRPQDYYDQAKWRGTWEFDGGALCNQAAHYVDLMQWFGGAVESVQAFSATLGRHIEAEDTIVVNLRYRSGALGSINVTTLTFPKNLEGSLTILGESGTARIGGVALNKIIEWNFDTPHPMDEEIKEADTNPKSVYGFGHLDFYRHCLDVLENGEDELVSGREGRKTVEIIEAAYQSALSGGQVRMCAMPR